jgi:hypothetical protein
VLLLSKNLGCCDVFQVRLLFPYCLQILMNVTEAAVSVSVTSPGFKSG